MPFKVIFVVQFVTDFGGFEMYDSDQKKYFYDFCFQIKPFVYKQISDVMCWLLSDSSLTFTPATLKITFIFIVVFSIINATTLFN